MSSKTYLSTNSFWTFVAGVGVALMIILAIVFLKSMNLGEEGQTRVIRGGGNSPSTTQSIQSGSQSLTPVNTQEKVSGVNPSFNVNTVSGVNPSFTTGTADGVNPSF